MPDDGSKLRDVTVLAEEGTELELAVAVATMPRLQQALLSNEGVARGTVRFERDRGFTVAEVQVAADLTLECQRCMQPMTLNVQGASRVFLPHSEAAAERVPEDEETMIALEGRLRLKELVEEDLLLALPIAPRHEDLADCGMQVEELEPEAIAMDVQMPFASLGALMGQPAKGGQRTTKLKR